MAPIFLWLKQHLSKMLQTSTTLVYQNTKKQYHGVSAMPCKQRLYKFLIFPEFSSPLFTIAQWNGSAANCYNLYKPVLFHQFSIETWQGSRHKNQLLQPEQMHCSHHSQATLAYLLVQIVPCSLPYCSTLGQGDMGHENLSSQAVVSRLSTLLCYICVN